MVILAALPGMVRELLVTGKIVHPGNFEEFVNSLGSQLRKVGLERYVDLVRQNIEKTLRNDATAPPERLRAWVDLQIRYLEQAGMRNGCLIGNCRRCSAVRLR